MALKKMNTKDHNSKKNPTSREKWLVDKKVGRPRQRWVPSSFTGTLEEVGNLSDAEVLAVIPAHWEKRFASGVKA
jgi:hypothetical protein